MLAVYTFVFSEIFNARWSGGTGSKTEFALVLFAGLIIFNLFAECINQAPKLILSNTNYVKKVVFPLELLPWITMGSAIFHTLISLIVWLIAYIILVGEPNITALMLPFVFIPFILMVMGLNFLLASLGVYLRDIGQMIGIITTALMFTCPLFFPVSSLPEKYRGLIEFNPLTIPIEQLRNILMWGQLPNIETLASYFLVSVFIYWLGFAWFQKTRKGFADVM
jgi:lipopolysaccharide transport system permease protein